MFVEERELVMLKKFVDAKNHIWGDESHACNIVYDVATQKYYAECESTLETKRLNENNYLDVLNEMFYDYCVENADYMGVS